MELQKKQDITTGNGITKTPILEKGADPTAAPSKPVLAKSVSSSIKVEPYEMLALLQTDFSDLQSLGLSVILEAKDDHIFVVIRYKGHKFDTGNGHILLDGLPVSKERSE